MSTLRNAFVIAAALFALTAAERAEAQVKIGVVDLQRALNETEDGRAAKNRLKKLFDQRQKTLDKQQEDLRLMKENIEKQRDVLSREVLAKKLEEYQKTLASLQSTYVDFQRELAAKEGELTGDIMARMHAIAKRIGQAEGYTVILERNEAGVIYVPSTYDLTDVLIQRYNAGEGKAEAKGKGKGGAATKRKATAASGKKK